MFEFNSHMVSASVIDGDLHILETLMMIDITINLIINGSMDKPH